ncbi:IS1 family transposase [Nostoc flagelliforme FACHB-838]|uniref:IS1 family transposase n=1 Tax=Nostoc flagelliforme FACHB-838 TaxID=2692904 RepID=A0ABR8E232_9NOSO|nr:IS1 family transposase [Nostoc flagelliforme]MBD2534615.1 IS1 family transposase [Nostoc flagelliforme FACHB-838]
MPACPICASSQTVKNGRIHNGKQRFKCHDCGRQFVEHSRKKVIDQATRELVDRLLLERISLAGIARAAQVSEQWLQIYVNEKYAQVPRSVQVTPKKKGRLTIQCDELWSFVDNKENKQWIWLAQDAGTREIVGVYIGARSEAAARKLWESLPPVYRQRAIAYTDFWAAYAAVLPSKRHQAVGKETGFTSYIERFNNTLRQRVSRLVRKTLSFSKSLENHIGAIWYFIHYYNASLLV